MCLLKMILTLTILGSFVWSSSAIRGGTATSLVYNPHLVSISINDNFACAGSLLAMNWVITVASCVKDIPIEKLQVRAGSPKTDADGETRKVEQVWIYPSYNWYTQDYDLAVLRVDQYFTQGPKTKKIELAKEPVQANDTLIVVGWGETGSGHEGELKRLQVPLISADDCKEKFKYDVISPRMICSWVDENRSPCWDDFGNPLKNKYGRLVGMYTWTRECQQYPSVYTYVYPYSEWIASLIPELSPKH